MLPIRAAVGIAIALLGVCGGVPAQSPAPQQPAGTASIVGHVLGQNGEPLPNADVWATAPGSPDQVVRRTRTDGDGMFVLGRLPSPLLVWARAPSMTTTRVLAVPLANTDTCVVDLRLWEARALRGRILDPDGKPIAGASLVASKDFATFAYEPIEGTTDAQGRFELRGAPIGECCLRAIAPGFAFNGHVFGDVFDEQIDLRLPRHDGIPVRIQVTGLPAAAAAAAEVRLQAVAINTPYSMPRQIEQLRLAADGTCTVKGLPETAWVVTLRHPEFRFVPATARVNIGNTTEPVRVTAMPGSSDSAVEEPLLRAARAARAARGISDPQLRADQSVVVRGRVVDARGFAVPYATVDVLVGMRPLRSLNPSWAMSLRTTSGADGSFTLSGVPPTSIPMRLRALGANAAGVSEELTIGAGSIIEQDVTTGPVSRVEGRLLDPFGEGVPGVSMKLEGAGTLCSVMTDHQGRFVFVGLAPGSYGVTALHRRCWQYTDQPAFEVHSGETTRRDLVLQ